MKSIYVKTILTAYKSLDSVVKQIDELVLKRALASFGDCSPCEEQCRKVVNLMWQKDDILKLSDKISQIIAKLNENDYKLLDYKYFRTHSKEYYKSCGTDFTSRQYFRRQIAIAKKFGDKLEKSGITDKVFEEVYLKTDFFASLKRRISESEKRREKRNKTAVSTLKKIAA